MQSFSARGSYFVPCLALFLRHCVKQRIPELRRLTSNYNRVTPGGNIPHHDSSDVVLQVHDTSPGYQWTENPEMEYTSTALRSIPYDFIQPTEYFQLDEIRRLLKRENIRDLVFIELPPNHVCRYMVIGSGVSRNHVRSTASIVYRVLKHKRRTSSLGLPILNGLDGPCTWIALNLGNILLHLFLPSVREYYDLEGLWAAGPEYDEVSRATDAQSRNIANSMYQIDWNQLIREVQRRNSGVPNLPNDEQH